jgi:hypothetical protein
MPRQALVRVGDVAHQPLGRRCASSTDASENVDSIMTRNDSGAFTLAELDRRRTWIYSWARRRHRIVSAFAVVQVRSADRDLGRSWSRSGGVFAATG